MNIDKQKVIDNINTLNVLIGRNYMPWTKEFYSSPNNERLTQKISRLSKSIGVNL